MCGYRLSDMKIALKYVEALTTEICQDMYEHANTYMRNTFNTVESRINETLLDKRHHKAMKEAIKLCNEVDDVSLKQMVSLQHVHKYTRHQYININILSML